jgi:hypothetical protein
MARAVTAAIVLSLAAIPGVAPEFEGITSPMPMPDQVGPQPSSP